MFSGAEGFRNVRGTALSRRRQASAALLSPAVSDRIYIVRPMQAVNRNSIEEATACSLSGR